MFSDILTSLNIMFIYRLELNPKIWTFNVSIGGEKMAVLHYCVLICNNYT